MLIYCFAFGVELFMAARGDDHNDDNIAVEELTLLRQRSIEYREQMLRRLSLRHGIYHANSWHYPAGPWSRCPYARHQEAVAIFCLTTPWLPLWEMHPEASLTPLPPANSVACPVGNNRHVHSGGAVVTVAIGQCMRRGTLSRRDVMFWIIAIILDRTEAGTAADIWALRQQKKSANAIGSTMWFIDVSEAVATRLITGTGRFLLCDEGLIDFRNAGNALRLQARRDRILALFPRFNEQQKPNGALTIELAKLQPSVALPVSAIPLNTSSGESTTSDPLGSDDSSRATTPV